MKREQYEVHGTDICDRDGGILYDHLSSAAEAQEICDVLNDGIGPDWDTVELEMIRRRMNIRRVKNRR